MPSHCPSNMSFLRFPVELQVFTLRQLPFRDLLHCRALCKYFRLLIDSSKELLFIKELGAAGLKDNVDCLDSVRKKAGNLWKTNIAWANLHWRGRRQIQLSGTGRLFDISDGLFFHTTESTDTTLATGTTIEWFKLPSRREFNPERSPKQLTFSTPLVDFAVDATRDLIIGLELTSFRAMKYFTVQCNLHPRTISTSERHPSAAQRALSSRFVSLDSDLHPRVEICGNHVAVLLMRPVDTTNPNSFDTFILLDWTSGVAKATMGSYVTEECWETFCFLSADSVLIPSARDNLLNIYHFDDKPDSLKHTVSLLLPEPLKRDGLRRIYLRSQPFSYRSGYCSHPASDNPPFTSDPDEAVIAFHLDYEYHAHGIPDVSNERHNLPQVFAVPRRILDYYAHLVRRNDSQLMSTIEYSHGRKHQVKSKRGTAPRAVSEPFCVHEKLYAHYRKDARNKRFPHLHAEQWIQNTRWGLDSATPSLGCFAYGSRYLAMSSRVALPNAPASSIALYDFNLRNERRGLAHVLEQDNIRPYPASDEEFNEDEDWDYDEKTGQRRWPVFPAQIVTTPSIVSVPQVFKRSFTTTLPYRVIETDMVFPWDTAIIDGERIIGLEFSEGGTGSIETLDVIVI